MVTTKMSWLSVLIYQIVLLDIALGLALPVNKAETKTSQLSEPVTTKLDTTTVSPVSTKGTTELPNKAIEEKHVKTEESAKHKESLEKPLPKKRGVIEELYRTLPENFDDNDVNDEPTPEELLSYSRPEMEERPFLRFNDYGDSGLVNGDGYYENDGRRKRTAMYDSMYNRGQELSNPDVDISPDEVMALLRLLDERRLYNPPPPSSWSDYDNTIDSIEADMRDEDVYRERPDNRYGDATYEGNFDNFGRYPTGMKRYVVLRRRSDPGNPKLKVPVFRRAVL